MDLSHISLCGLTLQFLVLCKGRTISIYVCGLVTLSHIHYVDLHCSFGIYPCTYTFIWTFVAVFEVSMKSFVYVYMNYGHFYFYNQNLSVQCLETFMLTSAILKLFPHYNVLCALPYILLKFYVPVYGLSKFYMDF